jgi:hypothetical protein
MGLVGRNEDAVMRKREGSGFAREEKLTALCRKAR